MKRLERVNSGRVLARVFGAGRVEAAIEIFGVGRVESVIKKEVPTQGFLVPLGWTAQICIIGGICEGCHMKDFCKSYNFLN